MTSVQSQPSPAIWSRREFILGGSMLAAAGAATLLRPRKHENDEQTHLNNLVPGKFGRWTMAREDGVLLPANRNTEGLYDLLTRVYTAPGFPPMMLLIAFGRAQSTSTNVHRPEDCYRGTGFTIDNTEEMRIHVSRGAAVPGRLLETSRGGDVERVLYWRRISNEFSLNTIDEKMVIARRAIEGVIADGLLMRISTREPSRPVAVQAMQTFARELVEACSPRAARLLLSTNYDGWPKVDAARG